MFVQCLALVNAFYVSQGVNSYLVSNCLLWANSGFFTSLTWIYIFANNNSASMHKRWNKNWIYVDVQNIWLKLQMKFQEACYENIWIVGLCFTRIISLLEWIFIFPAWVPCGRAEIHVFTLFLRGYHVVVWRYTSLDYSI